MGENLLEHIAIHEAGHAVVGRIVTTMPRNSSILIDSPFRNNKYFIERGLDEIMPIWEQRQKFREIDSAVRALIISIFAGCEAEYVILGKNIIDYNNDYITAKELAHDLTINSNEEDVTLDRIRKKTRGLVRRHEISIRTVAELLIRNKTVYDHEIQQVIIFNRENYQTIASVS